MIHKNKLSLLLGILIVLAVGLLSIAEAIEPVTEINACGAIFSAGTSYVLTQDVRNTPGTDCFSNFANDVVLDCQGHAIIAGSASSTDTGVQILSRGGITIKNCVITGFYRGLSVSGANNLRLVNNVLSNNNPSGIVIFSSTGLLSGTTSCGNSRYNLYCNSLATFSGTGNFFSSEITNFCSGGWPVSGTDYTTCGADGDVDGFPDTVDNCPRTPNRDQADADVDYIGDACDAGAVCISDAVCGTGLVCQAGFGGVRTCQEAAPTSCVLNSDCVVGSQCVAGSCVLIEGSSCLIEGCPQGQVCADTLCQNDNDWDSIPDAREPASCLATLFEQVVNADGCLVGDFNRDGIIDTIADINEANLKAKWVEVRRNLLVFNQFIQMVRQNMAGVPN